MTTESPTTSPWVCPAGVTHVDISIKGGGGGGGTNSSQYYHGDPGAPGSTTTANLVAVTPGTSYAFTLGGGGAGSWWNTAGGVVVYGTAGGTTSFLGYTAAGGANGGLHSSSSDTDPTPTPNGGAGGEPVDTGGKWCLGGDGGSGTITITYTLPSSAFTGTPLAGPKTLTVSFTGPASCTAYSWDFGDSGTATTQSPSHDYTTPGRRTVILATTNAYGFTATTKVDYVSVYFKKRMHCATVCSDELRKV